MASLFLSTPYTPVFPPPLPKKPIRKSSYSDDADSSSSSCPHQSSDSQNDVPYIQKLKQRHLQLASIPHQLCSSSRENSPDAQSRVDSIRVRMRERQERGLPFELALTCVGVAGGDWVGEALSDLDDDKYILPHSEAEWFRWEKRQKAIREKRKAERQAQQRRDDIAKWTEGVQADNTSVLDIPLLFPQTRPLSENIPLLPSAGEPSPPGAPVLEPLHDFNESASGNSAPSLPFSISALIDIPCAVPSTAYIPLPIPPIPLSSSPPRPPMHVTGQPKDASSLRDNQLAGTNPQLSSPISPPRSLKPLTTMTQASFPVSSKRLRDDENVDDFLSYNSQDILDTPRPNKRFKPADEPITPKSVERRTLSQPSRQTDDAGEHNVLPTLMELLASSKTGHRRRTPSGRKSIRSSETPRQGMLALPEVGSSHIPYSMFIPQAHSTQVREFSLPPAAGGPTDERS